MYIYILQFIEVMLVFFFPRRRIVVKLLRATSETTKFNLGKLPREGATYFENGGWRKAPAWVLPRTIAFL